jgi:hypothetical protein
LLKRVFRYADRLSKLLYAIGILCMATSGTALPLLDLIFGQFVNTFNVSVDRSPSEQQAMHSCIDKFR